MERTQNRRLNIGGQEKIITFTLKLVLWQHFLTDFDVLPTKIKVIISFIPVTNKKL